MLVSNSGVSFEHMLCIAACYQGSTGAAAAAEEEAVVVLGRSTSRSSSSSGSRSRRRAARGGRWAQRWARACLTSAWLWFWDLALRVEGLKL